MSAWNPDRAESLIRERQNSFGALLPILHSLQEEFGYVDEAAVPLIARALNLSQADVLGTISFYHDFRRSAPGRHILKVCRAEACQSMGCDRLIQHINSRLGVGFGETTPDGSVTLEQVFCLGLCAMSPAMMLDGKPYGRVSPQIADLLLEDARRQI